ncbi:MAG TPA: hypothetical protein PK522_07625, partial [Nitrosomonas sp.]|nr:hypothetical protein [Nitrosomonas sp.]
PKDNQNSQLVHNSVELASNQPEIHELGSTEGNIKQSEQTEEKSRPRRRRGGRQRNRSDRPRSTATSETLETTSHAVDAIPSIAIASTEPFEIVARSDFEAVNSTDHQSQPMNSDAWAEHRLQEVPSEKIERTEDQASSIKAANSVTQDELSVDSASSFKPVTVTAPVVIDLPDLSKSGLVMIETTQENVSEILDDEMLLTRKPRRKTQAAKIDAPETAEPLIQIETKD